MKCPGQDTRYWKPGDIFETECPHCGAPVEFFKDEATRKCPQCKSRVVNPKMNFGCAAYCQFAEQCLGDLGPEILAKRNDLFKDRVALEVKKELGKDFQKLAHALKVARHVEEIARKEKTEPAIMLCAAYLHVFYENREGGDSAGPQTARAVLERLGAGPDLTAKVLHIIDEFIAAGPTGSGAVKIFSDAHRLSLQEESGQSEQIS